MNREKKAITVALYGLLIALAMVLSFVETMIPIRSQSRHKAGTGEPCNGGGALFNWNPRNYRRDPDPHRSCGTVIWKSLQHDLWAVWKLLSLFVMAVLKETGKLSQVSISVLGGIAHNIGQITFAAVIVQTPGVFYYLPFLLAAGCIAGTLIGIVGGIITERLQRAMRGIKK